MHIDLLFKEIGKGQHRQTSYNMSVSNVDMRVHPMIEGSFCDEEQKSITYLSQNHEEMRLETPVSP